MKPVNEASARMENEWTTNPRWKGITRPYTAPEVLRLSGSVRIEYSLDRMGAERLWKLHHEQEYVAGLGAVTGNQAIQQVQAGLNLLNSLVACYCAQT